MDLSSRGPAFSHKPHYAGPRAFTLIELILVMALLSIVLAVSAPALSGFFRGRTADAAARRLVSLIRYGQSRAVSEGVPVILWIDARRGTYGLEQEPGYVDLDPKAVRFELPKDLRIEVTDLPAIRSTQAGPGLQAAQNASVPRLRFQPDGFIGETSPQTVVFHQGNNDSIWVTQTRNRLSYEIHTSAEQNLRGSR